MISDFLKEIFIMKLIHDINELKKGDLITKLILHPDEYKKWNYYKCEKIIHRYGSCIVITGVISQFISYYSFNIIQGILMIIQ